ncbi:hypothetical protein tb265_11270 [Gemmatimonadetes bacterium T265]|nr:hypothetical protein tb265_11270 [Gemmatimonadetes bacterium T265]
MLPAALVAQTVAGRVVDSAMHRPVAGLAVRLVTRVDSVRDTVVVSGQTGADGAFYLDAPKPGTYYVALGVAYLGPPITLATADADDQREYVIGAVPPSAASPYHVLHGAELDSALGAQTPLLACQVEKKAALVPGKVRMMFPPDLRDHGRTGSLLATFIVDTLGRLDASTLQISRAPGTDEAFATSVAQGLAKVPFYAAATDGRKVRQRMYVPVTFRINMEPAPPLLQGDPCGPTSSYDAVIVTAGRVGAGYLQFPRFP